MTREVMACLARATLEICWHLAKELGHPSFGAGKDESLPITSPVKLIDKSMPSTVEIRWRIRIEGLATPCSN